MRACLVGNTTRCVVRKNGKCWKVEQYRKMINSWNKEVWVLTNEFNCDEFIEKHQSDA